MEDMSVKEHFNKRVDWFLGSVKKIEDNRFGLDEKRQFEAMYEVHNRFLDSIKKNIEEIIKDEGMHDSLLTSMQYWQASVFNRHAMPTLKTAVDEHNISEKNLGDLIYDIQMSLHEKKVKPVTYDVYMRSVQEVADNLSVEEGVTIQ